MNIVLHWAWISGVVIISSSLKISSISGIFKFCVVVVALSALEPHSTDSLVTQHPSKFESTTNRWTFEKLSLLSLHQIFKPIKNSCENFTSTSLCTLTKNLQLDHENDLIILSVNAYFVSNYEHFSTQNSHSFSFINFKIMENWFTGGPRIQPSDSTIRLAQSNNYIL